MDLTAPWIICGCPGSGTSLVTRILRQAGLFVGSDAGELQSRKFHESASFRNVNSEWLRTSIDFPHAPKDALQFRRHIDYVRRHRDAMLRQIRMQPLLTQYWGSQDPGDCWGWKDPRNSANLLLWRELFPHARILIIQRKWRLRMRWQRAQSLAGSWFRHQSRSKIRSLYWHPPGLDGLPVVRVDVDRLLREPSELQKLLQQFSLPQVPTSEFEHFLDQAGVERGR